MHFLVTLLGLGHLDHLPLGQVAQALESNPVLSLVRATNRGGHRAQPILCILNGLVKCCGSGRIGAWYNYVKRGGFFEEQTTCGSVWKLSFALEAQV